ncbi:MULTISPECIES: glycosyltransferase family 39 protein [Kitasatospora]|uniref:Putative glycosyltransferase n=1 Tax=Kitasatospora setae (strain ATCC 33774 / DSM 43861 / JCM 3304 / KCC A-0304 / NBRC 14216 / KM-6054) TaxID=452652 RepID=E4N994_KITSK|nr:MULTISPECIES: glycosyltransferase family 39 protein [Kitasatospora]BAJ27775.1 putative glycosyltransferase [Kitasatospora setae KM-6054]
MTTSSSVPPTSEPWPDAAKYPPPTVAAAADSPTGSTAGSTAGAAADPAAGPTRWPDATPLPPAGAGGERPAEALFPPVALPPVGPKGRASWAGRLRTLPARTWRGRADDARWVRPAFLGLLLATAVLYFWNLTASGWANAFYSAAVQAGSVSWKAMFFGSSDAANFITVDKPPLSLWPMALSARILGLNSFSVLAPQVLMGVGTVAAVYATVRRRFSALGGLVAGAALALTPVAALMFRFNNPDALLVLLLTLAAYGIVRATEAASTRWIVFVGVMLGLAFLAKTLQAFLVLPGFALVYLVCAPTAPRRRLLQLLYGTVAMVVAGGWWVAIVELMPASARPYIGGSQDNSFLSLTFGYNGFGRITGNETGSVGGGGRSTFLSGGAEGGVLFGGPGGAGVPGGTGTPGGGGAPGGGGGMWGSTGLTRLFDGDIGGQIAWLMPAALILLAFGLWATRRHPRTDSARTAFLVWGGWLLSTGLTFSFMSGIFHQYYTVALVPAVAALVGMGADGLWRARHRLPYAAVLAVTVLVTAWWAHQLLGRSSQFVPWLRNAVLIGGILAALALLFSTRIAGPTGRRIATLAGLTALAAGLAGPTAYALDTVSTGHSGSIVTAGPAVQGDRGGFGGRGGFPGGGRGGGTFPGGGFPGGGRTGGQNGTFPGFPGGGTGTGTGTGTGESRDGRGGFGGTGGMAGGRMGGGGMGGLLNGAQVSAEVADLLKQDADKYTWVAAAVGSQNQASYQLASGEPVMALGGFNGSDPSLSLDGFKKLVAEGKVHWFIGGGGMGGGGMGGSSYSSEIASWVSSAYTAKTVGSTTMYDLTATPKSGS